MSTLNCCLLLALNIGLLHAAPTNRRFCMSIMRMDCSVGFVPNVICGNNGITYPNDCAFSKGMCETNNLKELHKGVCVVSTLEPTTEEPTTPEPTTPEPTTPEPTTEEPTTESTSVENKFCKTIMERNCDNLKDEFFCGTDGHTYENDCLFSKAMCIDLDLDEDYKGPCIPPTTTGEPTTEEMTMEPTTEEMTMEPTTEEMTMEPTTEEMTLEPTTEEMTLEPTTEEMTLELTTEEMTLEPTTEEMTQEPTTETPVEITTISVVETTKPEDYVSCQIILNITCTGFQNVCIYGSDGVTYPNDCEFLKAVCQDTDLKELYRESCVVTTEAPDTTTTNFPTTLEPTTPEVATEEILTTTPSTKAPSTVTTPRPSGVTMDFRPIIKEFFCTWSWEQEIECDPSSKDYTCASDTRTYRTKCDLAKANCDYPNLHVVKEGICDGDKYAFEYKHHSFVSHLIMP